MLVLRVVWFFEHGSPKSISGFTRSGQYSRSHGRLGGLIDCSVIIACCGYGKPTMLVLRVVCIFGRGSPSNRK